MTNADRPGRATGRRALPPLQVVLICCVASALASFVIGAVTLLAAAVLVVVALVRQARAKDPATWFAASVGVAAGALLVLLLAVIFG